MPGAALTAALPAPGGVRSTDGRSARGGETPAFLPEVAALVVAAAAISYLSGRVRQVPIIGFLAAGVLIGPNALGLVRSIGTVEAAAEIGVILLLFTIGIEFSLDKLKRIRRLIVGGGAATLRHCGLSNRAIAAQIARTEARGGWDPEVPRRGTDGEAGGQAAPEAGGSWLGQVVAEKLALVDASQLVTLDPAVIDLDGCGHLPEPLTVRPSAPGCEECLRDGTRWVHPRVCMACGHVGCCDSSPGRHAGVHHRQARHPLMRSLQPGEDWAWCYPDERRLLPS